jgi:hypothetical protein
MCDFRYCVFRFEITVTQSIICVQRRLAASGSEPSQLDHHALGLFNHFLLIRQFVFADLYGDSLTVISNKIYYPITGAFMLESLCLKFIAFIQGSFLLRKTRLRVDRSASHTIRPIIQLTGVPLFWFVRILLNMFANTHLLGLIEMGVDELDVRQQWSLPCPRVPCS